MGMNGPGRTGSTRFRLDVFPQQTADGLARDVLTLPAIGTFEPNEKTQFLQDFAMQGVRKRFAAGFLRLRPKNVLLHDLFPGWDFND